MIERFAQGILADMLSRTPADQLAKVTPEMREAKLVMLRKVGAELVESFGTREGTWTEYQKGRLGYTNHYSRRLFEEATGISLGKTNKTAKPAIVAYVGQEVIDAWSRRIQAERDEKQAKYKASCQAQHEEQMAKLKVLVAQDKPIKGWELVLLAEDCGIPLHPRTIGTARKRVTEVNSSEARIYGGRLPSSIYAAYRQVRTILTQAAAQVEIVAG